MADISPSGETTPTYILCASGRIKERPDKYCSSERNRKTQVEAASADIFSFTPPTKISGDLSAALQNGALCGLCRERADGGDTTCRFGSP
jgi:hypothetical protein